MTPNDQEFITIKDGMRAPILNGANYRAWSFAMKFLLDGSGLWDFVEGKEKMPQDTTKKAAFRKKQKKAAMLIFQFCSQTPQSYIAHEEDPAKQWKILKNHYGGIDRSNKGQNLYNEFCHEQFANYNSMDEYGARLRSYQHQLAFTDKKLTDGDLISQLTSNLPREYDGVAMSAQCNSTITYMEVLDQLIKRESMVGKRRQDSKALIRVTKKDRNKSKRKERHERKDKYRKHDQLQSNSSNSDKRPVCTYCGRKGHILEDCFTRKRAIKAIFQHVII